MQLDSSTKGTIFIGRVISQDWPKGPRVELFITGETSPLASVELETQWRGAVTQSVDLAFDRWLKTDFNVPEAIGADLKQRLEKLRDEYAANLPYHQRTFRFVNMAQQAGIPYTEVRFILTEEKPGFSVPPNRYSINLEKAGSAEYH